ncbi:MAG: cyd operon YbgE family protein [Rubrivivax sp.]|nr:cyd operon YbgE family protein [Rubrivivax sp.]
MSHGAPAPAVAAAAQPAQAAPRMQLPALAVALTIMVGGTLYPPLMADATGRADHNLAMALFWAMSAGFVRGVGFVPRLWLWRWLFSGWACAAALALAGALKSMH